MGIQRLDRQSAGIVPIIVRNTTEETIPAYAVVAIGEGRDFGAFERDGDGVGAGVAIVPVRKPDAESIRGGNAALFLFVTDSPILPGKTGHATASAPTWVKSSSEITERGQEASPEPGSWSLQKGPGFWTVMDAKSVGGSLYAFVAPSVVRQRIFWSPEDGIPGRTGRVMGEAMCVPIQVKGNVLKDTDDPAEMVRNFSPEGVEGGIRFEAHWIDSTWVTNCCADGSDSSQSDQSDSQPSDSDPSASQPSDSDPSASQPPSEGSGSDKSNAIVPASWTPGGYAALFVEESPEVVFHDTMLITMTGSETTIAIDPHFVEVCEPGTIRVSGAVPDEPVMVGAKTINGNTVRIKLGHACDGLQLVVTLTAIRKGFMGKRFPSRTFEQFQSNERFIQSAYPGAGK